MIGRFRHPAAARLLAIAAFSTIASWVAVATADGRVRLDADTLRNSRGANQGSALNQTNCDTLNMNFPCLAAPANTPCVTCDVNTYPDVVGAGNGYTTGGFNFGGCGLNRAGICDGAGTCITGMVTVGNCQDPPTVVGQSL